MPQSLILLKKLPDPDYLHNLQAEGVYRASMNFLPGGCYAGAALYDASASYSMPMSSTSTTSGDNCPDPTDSSGCLVWEVQAAVRKLSNGIPQLFNAFVFLTIRSGSRGHWMGVVREVSADVEERAYVAAGHLQGCGSHNAVLEITSDSHDLLLDIQFRLTDVPGVEEFSVGRVRADDTRGWGEAGPAD